MSPMIPRQLGWAWVFPDGAVGQIFRGELPDADIVERAAAAGRSVMRVYGVIERPSPVLLTEDPDHGDSL